MRADATANRPRRARARRRKPAPDAMREAAGQPAQARLQPPLSGRPRLRILHSRRAARRGFRQARLRAGRPARAAPDIRSRLVDSIEICYREGRGEAILEFVPDSPNGAPAANARRAARFNERFACKKVRHRCTRSPSRGFSRSTIPTAPARAARASATRSTSISTASFPTKANRSTKARSSRGPSRATASCCSICAASRDKRHSRRRALSAT